MAQIGSNEKVEYSDCYEDLAIVDDINDDMDAQSKLEVYNFQQFVFLQFSKLNYNPYMYLHHRMKTRILMR